MITLQFHASWWSTNLSSRMLTISVSDNTDCLNNVLRREIEYGIVSDKKHYWLEFQDAIDLVTNMCIIAIQDAKYKNFISVT